MAEFQDIIEEIKKKDREKFKNKYIYSRKEIIEKNINYLENKKEASLFAKNLDYDKNCDYFFYGSMPDIFPFSNFKFLEGMCLGIINITKRVRREYLNKKIKEIKKRIFIGGLLTRKELINYFKDRVNKGYSVFHIANILELNHNCDLFFVYKKNNKEYIQCINNVKELYFYLYRYFSWEHTKDNFRYYNEEQLKKIDNRKGDYFRITLKNNKSYITPVFVTGVKNEKEAISNFFKVDEKKIIHRPPKNKFENKPYYWREISREPLKIIFNNIQLFCEKGYLSRSLKFYENTNINFDTSLIEYSFSIEDILV